MASGRRNARLVELYLTARERIVAEGYGAEIDWQESRSLALLSESEFLEEAAWVVLSSGMRETVVRKLFARITQAFLNWTSAVAILRRKRSCRTRALGVFNNRRKIEAVVSIATQVARAGFYSFREQIEREGISFISTLDFMGPATSYHLAKNIGLDVVKPDRHLVRIAKSAGFSSPAGLCSLISEKTGDRVSVIDVVLWRYATLDRSYTALFAC